MESREDYQKELQNSEKNIDYIDSLDESHHHKNHHHFVIGTVIIIGICIALFFGWGAYSNYQQSKQPSPDQSTETRPIKHHARAKSQRRHHLESTPQSVDHQTNQGSQTAQQSHSVITKSTPQNKPQPKTSSQNAVHQTSNSKPQVNQNHAANDDPKEDAAIENRAQKVSQSNNHATHN